MYAYIYIYMCVCVHVCLYVYISLFVYLFIYKYLCISFSFYFFNHYFSLSIVVLTNSKKASEISSLFRYRDLNKAVEKCKIKLSLWKFLALMYILVEKCKIKLSLWTFLALMYIFIRVPPFYLINTFHTLVLLLIRNTYTQSN